MTDGLRKNLQFGPFELWVSERVLRRDGEVLPLGGRALDILIYLAERPGEVIAKKELIDHVWPDVTVEEGSLRVHVAAIRKALRDGQFGNRYLANIKGRGYSFVGALASLGGATESRTARSWRQGRLPVRPIMMIGRDGSFGRRKCWFGRRNTSSRSPVFRRSFKSIEATPARCLPWVS